MRDQGRRQRWSAGLAGQDLVADRGPLQGVTDAFGDVVLRPEVKEALGAVHFRGEQVFGITPASQQRSLYFGCEIYDKVDTDAELTGLRQDEPLRFSDALYMIDAIKSGCHHPEGVLWIRTGEYGVHDVRASILDIPVTVYELMGVRAKIGLKNRLRGESLVGRFRPNTETGRQAA